MSPIRQWRADFSAVQEREEGERDDDDVLLEMFNHFNTKKYFVHLTPVDNPPTPPSSTSRELNASVKSRKHLYNNIYV